MQTVDRKEFRTWSEGYFLFRTENDFCAPNELECESAAAALENGETVGLTSGGKIISYLVPGEKVNREIPAKDYEGRK